MKALLLLLLTAAGVAQVAVDRRGGLEWVTPLRHPPAPVVVDGDVDEWSAVPAIRIDAATTARRGWATPVPQGPDDLGAEVRLCWTADALFLAAIVNDDEPAAKTDAETWDRPWSHDGLVLIVHVPPRLAAGSRGSGPTGQLVFGLNHYSPDAMPRPLPDDSSYVVRPLPTGYALEARLSFRALGWTPALPGDRFGFGLILVDHDPAKEGGLRFDQYGWNFGPGSLTGTGEARLLAGAAAAGDLVPARSVVATGDTLAFVGTIDAIGPARLTVVRCIDLRTGRESHRFPVGHVINAAGRYGIHGRLPVNLPKGRYRLELAWE